MVSFRSGKAEAPLLISDITQSRPPIRQLLLCNSVLDFPDSSRTEIPPSIFRTSVVASSTLLTLLRQWPIAISVARNLSVGDLISLARTSSSLRAALHGFHIPGVYDTDRGTNKRSHGKPDGSGNAVRHREMLQIGDHCTPYWEGLKRAAHFMCSSKTHTKGEKTRSCLYCSMPICESCVIKHSFGKNENTFKNRCRFMCQRCWDTGNQQRAHRFTGKSDDGEDCSHKIASETRSLCTCTSKDGWLCNDCKEKQNISVGVDGFDVCFGQYCETKLIDDRDRRKICQWCDKPAPTGRPIMKSSQAFGDKLMVDAKEFMGYVNIGWWSYSRSAEIEYQKRMRTFGPMSMSRRALRGNYAVKDDPDADVEQFLPNFDKVNYQQFCWAQPSQDEIRGSRHQTWKYNSDFLQCFMKICTNHSGAAFLNTATSVEPDKALCSRTNMDLWKERGSRTLDEPAKVDEFAERLEADFDACLDSQPDRMKDRGWGEELTLADDRTLVDDGTLADDRTMADDRTLADNRALDGEEALIEEPSLTDDRAPVKEQKLAGKKAVHNGVSQLRIMELDVEEEPQHRNDGLFIQQDDATSEVWQETESQARLDEQRLAPGLRPIQRGERLPEYGANTPILETAEEPILSSWPSPPPSRDYYLGTTDT